jgi:hypothetical protein
MAAWSERDADSRINGGNAFATGSVKTIRQSHNKHYGRV